MSHLLIPVGKLISDSWAMFVRDWSKTLRITAWLTLLPAVFFLLTLVAQPYENTLFWTNVVFLFLSAVIALWTGIRLMRWTLAEDRSAHVEKDEARIAWANVIPVLLVGILNALAILGGTLFFVFPGIWLAVSLMFSQFLLLEDGVWGARALASSHALVKGRWWSVFWRAFAAGFLFLVLVVVVTNILGSIVGFIAGTGKLSAVLGSQTLGNPVAYGARQLLDSIAEAVFFPLFVAWQVKLFHDLKKTR